MTSIARSMKITIGMVHFAASSWALASGRMTRSRRDSFAGVSKGFCWVPSHTGIARHSPSIAEMRYRALTREGIGGRNTDPNDPAAFRGSRARPV